MVPRLVLAIVMGEGDAVMQGDGATEDYVGR